jgi:hypothetical protein
MVLVPFGTMVRTRSTSVTMVHVTYRPGRTVVLEYVHVYHGSTRVHTWFSVHMPRRVPFSNQEVVT